jgi:LCP family protein required for cell wall assembly
MSRPSSPPEGAGGSRGYTPRHARPNASAAVRRRRRGRVLLGLGILTVLAVGAVVAGAGYVWYRYNQIGREDLALPEAAADGAKNYLIVGSDDREVINSDDPDADAYLDGYEPSGHRSDTIMVLRVDAATEEISLISFPRDLWVPIAGTDYSEKINAAYNGGPQRLIDTIHQNFDIDIHHYVEIDFASFKGIVEAVGGVPMYFDRPMRDEHSGLYVDEAGCITLDGDQALGFARSRYLEYQTDSGSWATDGTGDLGRVNRQQLFLRRIIDRAAGSVGDLDVRAMNDILSSTADNLKVDTGMDIGQMIELARHFGSFRGNDLVSYTLPVEEWTGPGGAAAFKLDQVAATPILNVFRGVPPGTVTPEMVAVSIENGSGINGQAGVASEALSALGFQVSGTGNAEEVVSRTVVRYAPGAEGQAVEVAKHLPAGTTLQADPLLEAGQVAVVTGPEFTAGSVSVAEVPVEAPPGTDTASSVAPTEASSHNPDVIDEPIGIVPEDDPAAACV